MGASKSLFVTFEGPEGAGKSTQIGLLDQRLNALGKPAITTLEPGGTALGSRIRQLVKEADGIDISPRAELLLFAASRAQLVTEVIGPHLAMGDIVLCDRYIDSTVAYQGFGRGISREIIDAINAISTQGISPDLTILLDLPVEKGLARKAEEVGDRFQQEEQRFHEKVREGYLKLAAENPQRWLVIDATLPREQVAEKIWERVSRELGIPSGLSFA